jgi:hypothetical protein
MVRCRSAEPPTTKTRNVLKLFDQFGQSQVDQATLLVERSARIRASSVRPGAGLYEQDPNAIVPVLFTQDPSWVARRKLPLDELLKYRPEEPESESDSKRPLC